MKATKNWGLCFCNCGKNINSGDEFNIIDGGMYLAGHEVKATRHIPAVREGSIRKKAAKKKKQKDLSDLPLFNPEK